MSNTEQAARDFLISYPKARYITSINDPLCAQIMQAYAEQILTPATPVGKTKEEIFEEIALRTGQAYHAEIMEAMQTYSDQQNAHLLSDIEGLKEEIEIWKRNFEASQKIK